MKAIRPLLIVHYAELIGAGTEADPMRRPLQVCLPDGTLLYSYDPATEEVQTGHDAFERLTACEAVEP
jgi:hypothetical protein